MPRTTRNSAKNVEEPSPGKPRGRPRKTVEKGMSRTVLNRHFDRLDSLLAPLKAGTQLSRSRSNLTSILPNRTGCFRCRLGELLALCPTWPENAHSSWYRWECRDSGWFTSRHCQRTNIASTTVLAEYAYDWSFCSHLLDIKTGSAAKAFGVTRTQAYRSQVMHGRIAKGTFALVTDAN